METRDALSAYGNPLIIIGSRYREKRDQKGKEKKKKKEDGAQLSSRDIGGRFTHGESGIRSLMDIRRSSMSAVSCEEGSE